MSKNDSVEAIAIWLEQSCDEQYLADRVRAGDYTKEKGHTKNCAAFTDDCPDHLSPSLVGVGDIDYTTKQEQGEPVAWTATRLWNRKDLWTCPADIERDLLETYTTPQQRKPLSEAAIEGLAKFVAVDDFNYDFARAIEKAHGIAPQGSDK